MSSLSASTSRLAVLVSLAVVTVAFVRRYLRDRAERKGHPLPPGPPLLPVLGNSLSVDPDSPWQTYSEWGEKYKSDIVYARLLHQHIVVLNTFSDSVQLLEKRSKIYSDRPYMASVAPYGHNLSFAFQHYGDHWRLCRRIFHQSFRAEAAATFRPMQLRRSLQLIVNLLEDPGSYQFHFTTFSSAVATLAAWDYEPSPRNDPMVTLADTFLHASLSGLTPQRAILLETFPFLLHLPDWFPGSWLKREARASRGWGVKMADSLFQYVQDRLDSEEETTGLVAEHIARIEELDDSEKAGYSTAIKHASVSSFLGSAETTTSMMMTFTLAMVENPQVWKRAHAEIDAVVGTDRTPDFEDRDSLPYVDAILREVMRWHPVAPLGLPHAVTSNDVYKGYFIPKGATILSNIWAISRDGVRYPNADKFIPERFLNERSLLIDDDPADFIFGFGRRICPGRYTADSAVWIAIATMLATLEFRRAKDDKGEDVVFEATFVNSITHRPEIFPCHLVPRPHVTRESLNEIYAK